MPRAGRAPTRRGVQWVRQAARARMRNDFQNGNRVRVLCNIDGPKAAAQRAQRELEEANLEFPAGCAAGGAPDGLGRRPARERAVGAPQGRVRAGAYDIYAFLIMCV